MCIKIKLECNGSFLFWIWQFSPMAPYNRCFLINSVLFFAFGISIKTTDHSFLFLLVIPTPFQCFFLSIVSLYLNIFRNKCEKNGFLSSFEYRISWVFFQLNQEGLLLKRFGDFRNHAISVSRCLMYIPNWSFSGYCMTSSS